MSGGFAIPLRTLWTFRLVILALVQIYLFSPVVLADEPGAANDQRLVRVARTYETLQLCSSFAFEIWSNEKLSDRYLSTSVALYNASKGSGWSPDSFASALVVVNKEKSAMEAQENDTRQSFSRRHYSGEPCDKAMKRAEDYLDGGLPEAAGS